VIRADGKQPRLKSRAEKILGTKEETSKLVDIDYEDDWINELDNEHIEAETAAEAAEAAGVKVEKEAVSNEDEHTISFREIVEDSESLHETGITGDEDADSSEDSGKPEKAQQKQPGDEQIVETVSAEADDQNKSEFKGVPYSRFNEINGRAKQLARESHEKDAQIKALEEKIQSYKLQSRVHGVELKDELDTELTEDGYLQLIEDHGQEIADLMWNQQKTINALKAAQQSETVIGASEGPAYTNEDVDAAIDATVELKKWREAAASGNSKMFQMAIDIDEQIPENQFASLEERYAHVEQQVLKRVKEEAAKLVQSKPQAQAAMSQTPERSLNDAPGNSPADDEFTRLMSMSLEQQMEYMDRLEQTNPALFARLEARIDQSL
jgi:hypothetical protein